MAGLIALSFTSLLARFASPLRTTGDSVKKIDPPRRRLFRWGGIVAGLAVGAGLAVAGSAAASASSPVTSRHAAFGSLPTIVLVHGAWANGSSWDGVVQRLQ
jgi:hypothetical protein